MRRLASILMCLGGVFAAGTSHAIDLKQAKVTQVVNDVQIISAADQRQKAAVINDLFFIPDILRTGAASRAELVAQDETVTRVGANTIFSFDPANRTVDLKQGSLLFHAPHGKGGGTIHTGSATASVLGTTLIVTTTPNGGFKVLDLEGKVEMKLSSGRKQKLDPGQMTFVLPGTNQPAPIIIFRIDELMNNSLLLKGFTETLESLPLIQNQSALQLKLLQSGKLADTGLYAGDNASPSQVEVLDVNTVSHGQQASPQPQPGASSPPSPPSPAPDPAAAEGADATINQPSLTSVSIPTPPNHVFTGISLTIPNEFNFANGGFSGFLAGNIFMNTMGTPATPSGAGPLLVDLSPYASHTTFNFLAVNNFSIEGSVTFQGLSPEDNLTLLAGNQLMLTPGISLIADVQTLWLSSHASLSLDNVSLYNLGQNLNLYSSDEVSLQDNSLINIGGLLNVNAANNISVSGSQLICDSAVFTSPNGTIAFDGATLNANTSAFLAASGAISLNNSTFNSGSVSLQGTFNGPISINQTTINASSSLLVASGGELDVTGSTLSAGVQPAGDSAGAFALNTAPAAGTMTLSSSSGSVNISGTSITARYLTLNSGDGILLDATGQSLTAAGSGATANLTAPNTITVNNANFSAFAVVNMAANTINLSNVAFGAGTSVTLRSLLGMLNIGSSLPGYVNFIQNVTYGGNPAQNYIGNGITVTRL